METVARGAIVTIFWLPDVHAAYGKWSGFPTLSAVQEGLTKAAQTLRRFNSVRWISSTEDAIAAPADAQAFIIDWLRSMHESKALGYWADIPPRSPTARMVVKHLGVESSMCGVAFAQFETLADAKAWISERPAFGREIFSHSSKPPSR